MAYHGVKIKMIDEGAAAHHNGDGKQARLNENRNGDKSE